VNEEVSRYMTGETDGMNLGVDSRDGVMHSGQIFTWSHTCKCLQVCQISISYSSISFGDM